jgi:putative component of membrane protein insertase Oxa1/YidC/SpoIIIJ protein YidD
MKQTIAKRGLLIGGVLSFLRILGCNPFRKPSAQKLQKLAAKLASQA